MVTNLIMEKITVSHLVVRVARSRWNKNAKLPIKIC